MNTRKHIVALAVAAALGASPLINLAHAAENTPPAAASSDAGAQAKPGNTLASKGGGNDASADAKTNGQQDALVKTVGEAYQAVQDIHAARLAIFEGDTGQAGKLVSGANDLLKTAQNSLGDSAMKNPKGGDDSRQYLPFDSNVSLAEGFVPAEKDKPALDQASKQMSKGDQKGAAESLKLADIDISVTAAMLPLKSTMDSVQQASKLIGQEKWQEANLALKSVEDSVVVQSWNYDGLPQQGTAQDGQQKGKQDMQQGKASQADPGTGKDGGQGTAQPAKG